MYKRPVICQVFVLTDGAVFWIEVCFDMIKKKIVFLHVHI